jgi:ATP-dependent RNA helicase RhlE
LVDGRAGAREAISLFSRRNWFLRDIEKLVGLNLPKENIRFSSQILMLQEPTGQGRQQRSTPKTKTLTPTDSNSFERPSQNNDRRSNR